MFLLGPWGVREGMFAEVIDVEPGLSDISDITQKYNGLEGIA